MSDSTTTKNCRATWAKTMIFVGASLAAIPMWVVLAIPAIQGRALRQAPPPPVWASAMMAIASALIMIGLLLGSRGIGKPLTLRNLLAQVFAFPCWVPVAIYTIGFALTFAMEMG